MLKLGLTGCAGSGKSEAAKVFSSLQVGLIDADRIARDLVEPGQPCYERIVEHFGASVLDTDGRLKRRMLRKKMLSEPSAKRELEAILHPPVRHKLIEVGERAQGTMPYYVFVVPLLIESGMVDIVDRILVIDCAKETCMQRLCSRDQCSRDEAYKLIEQQVPRKKRLEVADYVIDNNGHHETLVKQIQTLHRQLSRQQ